MKEIKATAPTPQDWIDLVRENERLKELLIEIVHMEKHLNGSRSPDLTGWRNCLAKAKIFLK